MAEPAYQWPAPFAVKRPWGRPRGRIYRPPTPDRASKIAAICPTALRAAYESGDGMEVLAGVHGVSATTISKILKAAGAEIRRRGGQRTGPLGIKSNRNAEICAMYESGRTLAEVGDFYGMTHQRVLQIIRRAGVPKGPSHVTLARVPIRQAAEAKRQIQAEKWFAAAQRRADIIAAYQRGDKLRVIAAEFGVYGVQALNTLLRSWGVPPRSDKAHNPKKYTAEFRAQVVGRYAAGHCVTDIVKEEDVLAATIYFWARKAGIRRNRTTA